MRAYNELDRLAAARPRVLQRTEDVVDAAGADRMLGEIVASTRAPGQARTKTAGRGRTGLRRAGLLSGGLGLAAAGVAAAVVLSSGTPVPSTGTPPVPGGPPTAQGAPPGRSAREILLAFASAAARAPATTGKYWDVHSRFLTGFADTWDEWETRNGASWVRAFKTQGRVISTPNPGPGWSLEGLEGAGFAPDPRILIPGGCTRSTCRKKLLELANHSPQPTAPSPQPAAPDLPSAKNNPKWPGQVTFGQLQRLPTNPVALKAWVVAFDSNYNQINGGLVIGDAGVYNCLSNLIAELPTPPAVRAAAFRALATLPHIEPFDGGKGLRFDFGGGTWATLVVNFTASGVHTISTTPGWQGGGAHMHRHMFSLSVTAGWVNRLPK